MGKMRTFIFPDAFKMHEKVLQDIDPSSRSMCSKKWLDLAAVSCGTALGLCGGSAATPPPPSHSKYAARGAVASKSRGGLVSNKFQGLRWLARGEHAILVKSC